VRDDFEKTPVDAHPAHARVSGEQAGASIRICNDRAASGRQSLKVTDSQRLTPTWQPHFYYEPHLTAGVVRQSFDVWMHRDAQFFTEWRDSGTYPRNVGPSVRFDGLGKVTVAGKLLARFPAETWLHVDIEAPIGKNTAHTFKLTIIPAGSKSQTFADLPISGPDFVELHWLGFSSTAAVDTAFYLDNLKFSDVD
jgi:hypothetical protein